MDPEAPRQRPWLPPSRLSVSSSGHDKKPQTGGLDDTGLFSHSLGDQGASLVGVLVRACPDWRGATSSLCPPMAKGMLRGTNPSPGPHPQVLGANSQPRAPPPSSITLGSQGFNIGIWGTRLPSTGDPFSPWPGTECSVLCATPRLWLLLGYLKHVLCLFPLQVELRDLSLTVR